MTPIRSSCWISDSKPIHEKDSSEYLAPSSLSPCPPKLRHQSNQTIDVASGPFSWSCAGSENEGNLPAFWVANSIATFWSCKEVTRIFEFKFVFLQKKWKLHGNSAHMFAGFPSEYWKSKRPSTMRSRVKPSVRAMHIRKGASSLPVVKDNPKSTLHFASASFDHPEYQ